MALFICLMDISTSIRGTPTDFSGGLGTALLIMFVVCAAQDFKEIFK